MADVLYLVVPCYNEEEALPQTAGRLKEKLLQLQSQGQISSSSRILFVDDGSKDQTWALIQGLHQSDPLFSGIRLAHNRGHQNALLAGLMTARPRCDITISLDADLQDDVNAIDGFLEEYRKGCDVVYGVRRRRDKDTPFKRGTARLFYRLMQGLGAETVVNHADYRLLSKQVLEALEGYREVNLFLRGIIPMIGYQSAVVEYDRGERLLGESKYPFGKMLALALNGITSFSVKPLRIISGLGIIVSLFSVFGLLYALISKWMGQAVSGWTAIVASMWLLGGMQLLCLGVCGEYIGKTYEEVKQRPRYIIESALLESKSAGKELGQE